MEQPDWSKLRHASGTCEEIPQALLDLVSEDQERRRAAYWRLDNHVVVQGSLYEPALYVARAAIAQISYPSACREEAYKLLAEFAWSSDAGNTQVEVDGERVSLDTAMRRCLCSGAGRYLTDMRSEAAPVRKHIADLLLGLGEDLPVAVDRIRDLIESESNAKIRDVLEELMDIKECEQSGN